MKAKKLLFSILFGILFSASMMAQNVWINEIHYDNSGGDVGEFVEVVLQDAGTFTLSDFAITKYNGNGGGTYGSATTLDQFTIGSTISGYTFYYFTYPSNGLQNGSPDGLALSHQGTLIAGQFISYEGAFTATNGLAAGVGSVNMGVSESSSTPIGHSLQLGGSGTGYASFTWEAPQAETPGSINANQTLTGAVDPEPTNYPTSFLATPQIFAMDLGWTDAIGAQLPSGYLILASDMDNIVLPVDGTPVTDDPDLSDGSAALNISQGTEAASFLGLPGNQLYYFKIFPYTNGGPGIDYKTDGTPPATSALTPDVVIINEEDFEAGLGTWSQHSVTGNQVWGIQANYGYNGTDCAKMNGYSGGSNINEDWLISPVMNFNHYTNEHFQFQTAKNYSGPDLETLISNDYSGTGDPNNATWTPLSPALCPGGWAWTFSGSLDISGTVGSGVYLAFKYTSTSSQSSTWEVDAILVTGTTDFAGPTVVTDPTITNITDVTATGGGDVTDDGGSAITSRGICWATTINPTLADAYSIEAGTTGPFTSDMMLLSPNTSYYVRAYAVNALGTSFGDNVSFTTLCIPFAPIADFWALPTTIMAGQSVDFFDGSDFCPDEWNWSFVGGVPMSSTVQNPTGIVWDYPGVYNVCLTVTNAHGSDVLCKSGYIIVNAPIEADIVITEIMYNPPESGTDSTEFIELYNNDVSAVNLQNFYFSKGVTYTFPNYVLQPGEYVIVAESSDAMQNTFGVSTLQWTDGALNNGGEEIVLNEPLGFVIDSVTYDDALPWDSLADGFGPSLELCDPGSNNSLAQNWRVAIEFAGVNTAGDTLWASPLSGCSYPPMADFSADDTTILVGGVVNFTDLSSGTIDSYLWTFEGGDPATFVGATPPAVTYNDMGEFDVTLEVTNIAGQSTMLKADHIEVGPSGISSGDNKILFAVYPNPVTDGSVTVNLPIESTYEVSLITELGKIVRRERATEQKLQLSTGGFTKGIYFIRVKDLQSGKHGIKKVVIQ